MDSLLYTVWFDILIHFLIYYLDHLRAWYLYHFSSDCHSLYVDLSDIPCTLLDCMWHDCPSSAWLNVACLCRPHIYPLTSNSLGLGHSLHYGSHYYKCEALCVFVTLTEPEIRGRVWRRAIPMFGSILEVTGTLMSGRVRSLKTIIALS